MRLRYVYAYIIPDIVILEFSIVAVSLLRALGNVKQDNAATQRPQRFEYNWNFSNEVN